MAFSHFGSDPPHWNSKSKHPRYCRSKKGWNSAPCKELNFEKQANPLVIKGLWKCERSHKAYIITFLAHNMLPYGQITSKQGLGSYQNQSADEMQQKRGAKSLFWLSWQNFILSCLWSLDLSSPWTRTNPPPPKMIAIPTTQKCNPGSLSSHVSLLASKSAKLGEICSCLEELCPTEADGGTMVNNSQIPDDPSEVI